jgi:cyclase
VTLRRRAVLQAAVGGLIGLSLSRLAAAAASEPSVVRVNDKLSVIAGVGGNVVALSTSDGVVLVDGGAAARTSALVSALRKLPGEGRVRTLFNTHWHADQTGSNESFAKAGAKIIAHEKTKLWLSTDHWVPAEERYEKARTKGAWPTETFYTTGTLQAGGERIDYGYLLEAHTDGDMYVFLRDSNVLVVGDAASPERDPTLDWFGGGWLGGRIDALALLLKLGNDATRFVPAIGPVVGRAEIQVEHDMLIAIFNRMVELMRKGYTTQAMLDEGVMQGLSRTWQDPKKFMYDAHKGIWAHHNTLSHDVV